MKKVLLILFMAFFGAQHGVLAQSCTINTSYSQAGYYPDSIAHAMVGQPYSSTVNVKVLTDTMIGGYHGTVDSIILNSIAGLPYQFTYISNPSSGHFPAGSYACINIYSLSNPADSMAGAHPLDIHITIYGKISGFPVSPVPDSITFYNLHIDPAPAGVFNSVSSKFDLSQNFPDPATRLTNIYYSLPASSKVDFKLYNLLGKIVYQKSFFADAGTGKITLDAKDFAPGIYMYNLSNGKATLTKRMVMASN